MRRSSSLQPRSLVAGGAFNALGAGARADLESISVDCRLPCGVALFHENTPGTHVLLIHSGRVKLPCTSRDDRTLLLKVAVPGDILGLSAVVSRSCYEVTARTIAPTILRRVLEEPLRSLLATHVEASLLAAQTLSEAYRMAFADVRRLAPSGSLAARLAAFEALRELTETLSFSELRSGIGSSRTAFNSDL